MSDNKKIPMGREEGLVTIERIHEQMETSGFYPYNLQSGWLPEPGGKAMQVFFEMVGTVDKKPYSPAVEALSEFFNSNDVITYLVDNACKENGNIIDSYFSSDQRSGVPIPRIKDQEALLNAINFIITIAPYFIENDLVGVPMSAYLVGIDPTLSGSALFRLPMFNKHMSDVLNEWNVYLASLESASGFTEEGKQWLSPSAKAQYDFPIWKKDQETLPYWKSWNRFFTREFENPEEVRPIADPDTNKTVCCPNDGSLFRWDEKIAEKDVFWFKDMKYSLSDILSSELPEQQAVIDEHNLVDMFKGGYIFQTYLNPYNFHRWWVPVNGKVLFDPLVIPGCFFSKLVIPDFGGATTASTPYLAEKNARGLIVLETEDYGNVCCLPLGMSEISTVIFDKAMLKNSSVKDVNVIKGQEMGMFAYGGSSFVILFQNLPGKKLVFENKDGEQYAKRPILPSGSSASGGNVTNIGSKIGEWKSYIDIRGVWKLAVGESRPENATMTIVQSQSDDIGETYTGTFTWDSEPVQYDFFTATVEKDEITIVRSITDNPNITSVATQTFVGQFTNETMNGKCRGLGLKAGTPWVAIRQS